MVGLPMCSCQWSTGACLVMMVEARSAIIDDFHQVAPLFAGQRRNRPVVEDQQLHPAQFFRVRA
jgi:hypothetical protein